MTDEQSLALVRDEFDRLFAKPANAVDRAELFALANNIPWLLRLAEETLRLRAYRQAVLTARDNFYPSSQPEMDINELFAAIGDGED